MYLLRWFLEFVCNFALTAILRWFHLDSLLFGCNFICSTYFTDLAAYFVIFGDLADYFADLTNFIAHLTEIWFHIHFAGLLFRNNLILLWFCCDFPLFYEFCCAYHIIFLVFRRSFHILRCLFRCIIYFAAHFVVITRFCRNMSVIQGFRGISLISSWFHEFRRKFRVCRCIFTDFKVISLISSIFHRFRYNCTDFAANFADFAPKFTYFADLTCHLADFAIHSAKIIRFRCDSH